MASLDWSQCPVVESIPGKMSGAWVLRGTRMPVPESDPFILRRATAGEQPAIWYLEDGSGRGTAIVASSSLFLSCGTVAHAYLGTRV